MLRRLELENYRNYARLELDFPKQAGLIYLIGDNGQGKTNVLEAIYMLALAKSFRLGQDEKLIKWEEEFGRIKGEFGSGDEVESEGGNVGGSERGELHLETFLGKPPQPRRVLKKNNVKVGAAEFIGNVQVVFFHPEDLNLLYLGPELRRRYLDILNIQVNKGYFRALRKYNKIRAQRNYLLKAVKIGQAARADLEIWDQQMAAEAAAIYRERALSLEYLNGKLTGKYREIAQNDDVLGLNYQNSLGLNIDYLVMAGNIEELVMVKMQENLERDLNSEHSSVGPHRDDFEVNLNGRPIMEHASRGEFRSILLALKLIEIDFYKERSPQGNPILLLDDVFSELDHQRQKFLLETVKNYQTIITTTKDSAVINQEKLLAGEFIEIEGGKAKNNS
jgi:DNA replication and repair protein RecF